MTRHDDEDELLRSVALQNAKSILQARQRAEEELVRAKQFPCWSKAIASVSWRCSPGCRLRKASSLTLSRSLSRHRSRADPEPAHRDDGLASRRHRIPIELAIARISGEGSPLFTAHIQDFTDRKIAEAALEKQSEWLRVTLSSIGDAVVTTDAEGRVTFMNGVAEALTGWPTADAAVRLLTEVFRIVHERTRLPVADPALRALREGVAVGLANHTMLIARDGSERPIDDSAAPMRDGTGAIIGAVLVFRDITERHRVEQDLREADRQKDDFLAMLAHELRNPLAPLRNGLQVMRLASDDALDVAQARAVMDRQLGHMVRLVDDLLDASRIGRNKMKLRRSRVLLSEVVDNANPRTILGKALNYHRAYRLGPGGRSQ
jgi:PAS domain S-box-containing protein